MYGNDLSVSNEDIYDYLRTLDTFKEEENYSLDRTINNKSLSSGQMQKIAFIRAFLSDTEILLLDEATANLDDNSKDIIFKILKEKNITIINCTHDPESFENVDANLKISLDNEIRKVELINILNEKILIINTKYKELGGEDSNILDEIDLLSKHYKVEYLEFDNSKELSVLIC